MWPFTKKRVKNTIEANSITVESGVVVIDVRGQTCPGYLLSINKAIDQLDKGTSVKLLISYQACVDDMEAWCKNRKIELVDISDVDGIWTIRIKT
ncbi:MAG: sulfurtransferase TusA family protein [Granulosicoccus sp.]